MLKSKGKSVCLKISHPPSHLIFSTPKTFSLNRTFSYLNDFFLLFVIECRAVAAKRKGKKIKSPAARESEKKSFFCFDRNSEVG